MEERLLNFKAEWLGEDIDDVGVAPLWVPLLVPPAVGGHMLVCFVEDDKCTAPVFKRCKVHAITPIHIWRTFPTDNGYAAELVLSVERPVSAG